MFGLCYLLLHRVYALLFLLQLVLKLVYSVPYLFVLLSALVYVLVVDVYYMLHFLLCHCRLGVSVDDHAMHLHVLVLV